MQSQDFYRLKLDEPLSFNTPTGQFRWLRLPFGIKCTPEIYQRTMDQMLEGIAGAVSVMDNILIASPTVQEHDTILRRVVEKATNYNLRLNFNKCHIQYASLPSNMWDT